MRIIKCLAEKIEEELQDAEDYIDMAISWKEECPDAAELFYELSTEEMGHMDRLHKQAEQEIETYRRRNGDAPKDMMVLYNYMHEKQIAAAMKIKVKQILFKQDE